MIPLKIQFALKKKGINQKDIARELGVSEMAVSKVINKLIVSNRIMRAVAEKIGMDPQRVFPEYYSQPPKRTTSKIACLKSALF